MEMNTHHRAMPVVEGSQPAGARQAVRELAGQAGLTDTDAHRAALVATELATNLVKHADGGELLMRISAGSPEGEVEVIALDRGPGIRDVPRALEDGHSTAGSPGTGLGAIRRLSDTFSIHTTPGRGTVVLARVRTRRAPAREGRLVHVGVVSVPKSGETVCGDAWSVRHDADRVVALLADGLGHGVMAADAASNAVAEFRSHPGLGPADVLQTIHEGLRHTRGAAVAVAELRPASGTLKFAGVGNVAAVVIQNGSTRQAVSHNGTLGHQAGQFREYTYPWLPDALLVMHSDGLNTRWSLDAYPGLRQRHPSIVAAVLYRDASRQRDDVTVIVGRQAGHGGPE